MHSIQRLQPTDWARLKVIRLRALQDSPNSFGRSYAEEQAKEDDFWEQRLTDPAVGTFLAETDHIDLGMVSGVPLPNLGPNVMALFGMWVEPQARRQGMGASLVHHLIDWARAGGFEEIHLGVIDNNKPAVELYTRLGFIPTGERESLPSPREHLCEIKMSRKV